MSTIHQKFSLAFWKSCNKEQTNEVVSPMSIMMAFSMVLPGAKNNSLKELKSSLQLEDSLSGKSLYEIFHQTVESLNKNEQTSKTNEESPKITMANKLFVQKGCKLKQDFLTNLKKYFNTDIQQLNFSENVKAAETINSWVDRSTNSKIQQLYKSSDLNGDTRLIIANAIYFKGKWEKNFKKYSTQVKPFYLTASTTKEVSMMYQEKDFNAIENVSSLNSSVIQLPFVGHRFSLVLVVPKTIDGLADVENKLTENIVHELMTEMKSHRVGITMPKFKVESTLQLNNPMIALGAESIFDPQTADLSGICKEEKLFVSEAVHKAYLSVDEHGAEAAAVTGSSLTLFCLPPPPDFHINADRPFVCWIWDDQLKSMLFMARVSSPSF